MKGKKIAGFIIVSIIAVICCFVIISAIVPKNFNLELDAPDSITILKTSNGDEGVEETDEKYAKIIELFNKGFDVKFIEAFFQGKAFQKVSTLESTKNIESLITGNAYYIEFNYSEAKDVNLHGANLSLSSTEKQYRSIVFEIKNSNNLVQINAYLRNNNDSYSYVRYTSYAKFADLYNYIKENFEF